MAKFYVLLGPPGAGKGTQAAIIAEKCGIPHVSSGAIFRENLDGKTELGLRAKVFMEKGELVPDDITIAMVENRLSQPDCQNGALLDGYPRTPAQADALAGFLARHDSTIHSVPFINVDAQELVERLSQRWICKTEGHVYHTTNNPPKTAGVCDLDGSALVQRSDDKRETVQKRIEVYAQQTAPLIEYYRAKGLLVEFDGSLPIEEVTREVMKVVDG